MTVPEDTSKRDPLTHLVGAMGEGSSDYITGMEAAGQAQIVASTVLPIDTGYGAKDDAYEALGIVFGEKVDDLFREATLPEGWTRAGTDHAMWSDVLDERGVKRIAVFYKAAFYDRSAHMSLVRVGAGCANDFIYGDDEDHWDVLTDDERTEFISTVEAFLTNAETHPDIYGGRAPRARELLAKRGEQ